MKERLVEVKLPRCTVFLYPSEIQDLLRKDAPLYGESLKRGKRILRNRNQQARERTKSHRKHGDSKCH